MKLGLGPRRRLGWGAGVLLPALLAGYALLCRGDEPAVKVNVKWSPDYRALTFDFLGQECVYPRDVAKGGYPPANAPPVIRVQKKWPLMAMQARWTASLANWPPKYRAQAVDLTLMFMCDAQFYELLYPDIIRSSKFLFPPEYYKEAADPLRYSLAEALRGKVVAYQITAKAGFPATDYEIKTKIRLGLSEDQKTVFYHDQPVYISDYLKQRHYFVAGCDAGDGLRFDARIVCECAPAWFFKEETLNRVETSCRYFVQRIYENLNDEPTEQDIEKYLALIKKEYQDPSVVLQK
jgi:hypothetical protein